MATNTRDCQYTFETLSLLVRRVSDVPAAVHTYYKHQHCSSNDLKTKAKKLLSSFFGVLNCKNTYTLFDGLTYNTRGYFSSCVVFFRAP